MTTKHVVMHSFNNEPLITKNDSQFSEGVSCKLTNGGEQSIH